MALTGVQGSGVQRARRAASVARVEPSLTVSTGTPTGTPTSGDSNPPGSGAPSAAATAYWTELPSNSLPPPDLLNGRIPIIDVEPQVESGRRPAKAVVGEPATISATVFREGHDAVNANIVLLDPEGQAQEPVSMLLINQGLDRWAAEVRLDRPGDWSFVIEGWSDPFSTWLHRARVKIPAGLDVNLELEEGARVLERAASVQRPASHTRVIASVVRSLRNTALDPMERLAAATDEGLLDILASAPLRDLVTPCGPWPLRVERRRALVGSWYELFPRSEGATLDPPTGGTFITAAQRLPAIARMGFDVVYLPPIHPIGVTNRKGSNNTLNPGADDPGSPWAVGSSLGGHDTIDPGLGTLADFDRFVRQAGELGMEVALDLALQASPDHPWVTSGKPWFVLRADGSIAYAENPPKKYQDIYPIWFDGDPAGLIAEVERIVRFWADRGIRIFRVDNPHTKPLRIWDQVLANIHRTDPDILFLAEAFTRPPMVRALAEVGFTQNYTYFTWRNTKREIQEYLTELSDISSSYLRPNLFVNTPDILTEYLQYGGPAAFAIRATLAATLSPSWGMYAGFELFEHVAARPGSEEYLDAEKYQYRPRDWSAAESEGQTLIPYVTRLNQIRRKHPALQTLRGLVFHPCDNDQIVAYSRADGADTVIVVCTLDPYGAQEGTVHFNMPEIGLDWDSGFTAHDEISGNTWMWGAHNYVRLDPHQACAHVISIRTGTV